MYTIFQPKIYKFVDGRGSPVFFMITEISPAYIDTVIVEYLEANPEPLTAKGFEEYLNSKGYYTEITWIKDKEGGIK